MPKEYIEREDLISEFEWLKSVACISNKDDIQETIQRIKNAPAADVVEVVRCKDCKQCVELQNFNFEKYLSCNITCNKVEAMHYCSYGERKDGAE